MAEKIYEYFPGKADWLNWTTPDPQYNKYTQKFYPKPEALEKLRLWQAKGVKNNIKIDDENQWFVNLGRPHSREYTRRDGSKYIVTLGPPKVTDNDGKELPPGTKIGNGSDVINKCEFYQHNTPGGGKSYAMRWEATRIVNMVPYEPTASEKEQMDGLKDQPEDLF